MANKKKLATSVVAVATAAAMLLGGTFAWQSISQTALNEASDVVNPGGRLHDDFNGENKDVYVENFADEDIYARVRLEEYFEIVINKGAGEGIETTEYIVGSVDDDGEKVYEVFTGYTSDGSFDAAVGKDGTSWWSWTTGGQTNYLPTFNMNKDSLAADVNGTYAGPDGIEGVNPDTGVDDKYEDYIDYLNDYALPAEVWDDEVYDADANNIDEGDDAVEGTNIKTVENVAHYTARTGTATLISMEEWLAMNGIQTAAQDPYGVAPAFEANANAILRYYKNADDATGGIDDVIVPVDTELNLSDGSGFSRPGYTLIGWNTEPDGTGNNYDLGEVWVMPEGETSLYAVWQEGEGEQTEEPAYWVYDTDGWVYYSQPIKPDTATGLLLDGIELKGVMDDSWYYAINVVGQFITADDLGSAEDGTGFYDVGDDPNNPYTAPSEDALALLKAIGVDVADDNGGNGGASGPQPPKTLYVAPATEDYTTVHVNIYDTIELVEEARFLSYEDAETGETVSLTEDVNFTYANSSVNGYLYTLVLTDESLVGKTILAEGRNVIGTAIGVYLVVDGVAEIDNGGTGGEEDADHTFVLRANPGDEMPVITSGDKIKLSLDGIEGNPAADRVVVSDGDDRNPQFNYTYDEETGILIIESEIEQDLYIWVGTPDDGEGIYGYIPVTINPASGGSGEELLDFSAVIDERAASINILDSNPVVIFTATYGDETADIANLSYNVSLDGEQVAHGSGGDLLSAEGVFAFFLPETVVDAGTYDVTVQYTIDGNVVEDTFQVELVKPKLTLSESSSEITTVDLNERTDLVLENGDNIATLFSNLEAGDDGIMSTMLDALKNRVDISVEGCSVAEWAIQGTGSDVCFYAAYITNDNGNVGEVDFIGTFDGNMIKNVVLKCSVHAVEYVSTITISLDNTYSATFMVQ